MKRFPRFLAQLLILALLNVSYINLALANPGALPATPPARLASTPAAESNLGPEDTNPCSPEITKKCIENDIDAAKNDLKAFLGEDPNSFGNQLLKKAGLDPFADFEDAKADLNALSDEDFEKQKGQYNKLHKKAQKGKNLMAAILGNKSLMARIHNPPPLKFRVVVGNTAPAPAGGDKVLFKPAMPGGAAAVPSKTSPARGEFSKGFATMSVSVMPEYDKNCSPGPGLPGGADDLWISKAVTHATEFARELIPDDTVSVVAQVVVVTLWGAAKAIEIVLESTHVVYIECKNAQREWEVDQKFETVQNSFTDVAGEINEYTDTKFTSLTTTVNNAKTDIISNDNTNKTDIITNNTTNKTEIINNDNTNKTDIIAKISESGGKTTDAVNTSTATVTTSITNNFNTLNNAINTTKTELNTSINNSKTELNTNITNSKNEVNTNIDSSKTFIINNANVNAGNMLRLLIEADLAEPDSATPIALFMTPASKGGHLELVRAIVFNTIMNLTGATAAQANATLASGDALLAAGKYKAAFAAYRKAYKAATN